MAETTDGRKVLARNRKALHEYAVLESYEAGIVLSGPEVKSIRAGKVSLAESYARLDGGEVWLQGMHVTPYDPASRFNSDPTRPRKLLLSRREIRKLIGATQQQGFTLVPLDLYLRRGYVKLTLALGRGKKHADKREDLKRRDAEREMQRAVKNQ
jgi:SsrA-binding protein